jgi:hypothetical protein
MPNSTSTMRTGISIPTAKGSQASSFTVAWDVLTRQRRLFCSIACSRWQWFARGLRDQRVSLLPIVIAGEKGKRQLLTDFVGSG